MGAGLQLPIIAVMGISTVLLFSDELLKLLNWGGISKRKLSIY
jgi:hypothetical protein